MAGLRTAAPGWLQGARVAQGRGQMAMQPALVGLEGMEQEWGAGLDCRLGCRLGCRHSSSARLRGRRWLQAPHRCRGQATHLWTSRSRPWQRPSSSSSSAPLLLLQLYRTSPKEALRLLLLRLSSLKCLHTSSRPWRRGQHR